jgi:hypothetical protein
VLAPRDWAAGNGETSWVQTQVLIAGHTRRTAARLRCLQVERRTDGWEEGILRTIDFKIDDGPTRVPFAFDGVRGERERYPIEGVITAQRELISAARSLVRLTIRVDNLTPWIDLEAPRERVAIASLVSTHLLIRVEGGELLSAIDPPAWVTGTCISKGLYPVLLQSDLMLAAPFAMVDYPGIAPSDFLDVGKLP